MAERLSKLVTQLAGIKKTRDSRKHGNTVSIFVLFVFLEFNSDCNPNFQFLHKKKNVQVFLIDQLKPVH